MSPPLGWNTTMPPQVVKTAPVKPTGKKGSKATKRGNAGKKPAASKNLITTREQVLATPLGELPELMKRIDASKFLYDVDEHIADSGKYKGEKVLRLLLTTPDGVKHPQYLDVGIDLGDALTYDPMQVVYAMLYATENREHMKRGKRASAPAS
jgi:hypothetical protein